MVRTAPISSAKALYNFQFGNAANNALKRRERHHRGHGHFTDGANYVAYKPHCKFQCQRRCNGEGGEVVNSGVTANDFSSPVTYVVTAEDGSTLSYTVTVSPDGFVVIEAHLHDGLPESELGRYSDETQHEVTLTNGFYY